MTIDTWIKNAAATLQGETITSARLDAEIILAHTLRKSRTWLHAHGDDDIDQRLYEIAETRVMLRKDRVPIAYIVGHKEFYGRRYKVTPATLVPRPESEVLITLLKDIPVHSDMQLVDVGTGSGCLGITAKLECPELQVSLIDIDERALTIAEENAANLHADVITLQSSLLDKYPFTPDIIMANLPYVDTSWQRSPETYHEPDVALFAKDNGLDLIKSLLKQGYNRLNKDSHVILEADMRQHHAIVSFAESLGYHFVTSKRLGIMLQK